MPVYRLTEELFFPPAELAEENGLLAIGGDLRPERLIMAYTSGIFPWPHEGFPLLWFSPDPRMVMAPGDLRINRRMARTLRNKAFHVTMDTAFRQVVEACASTPRKDEKGTWITPEVVEAYTDLHETGYTHSVECWQEDQLAGGLYGVSIGAAFIGESMFTRVSDASKVAFITLAQQLEKWDFSLIDAQIHTEHLASLGARNQPRARYLEQLRIALDKPTRYGPWRLDL